jgi:O-antigen ligase
MLFQILAVMLIVVLIIALIERAVIVYWWRPRLLLGSQLNFTPILVVPAIFCTFSQFAPSRLWRWIGLGGFAAAVMVLSGVSMTRGPFIVMTVLVLLRALSLIFSSQDIWKRVRDAALLLVLFGITTGASLFDDSALIRFQQMMQAAANIAESTLKNEQEKIESFESVEAPDRLESIPERLMFLRGGLAAFAENPFFGHGPQLRYEAAARHFTVPIPATYTHLHNDFITHGVAGGIVALVLLVLILLTPTIAAWSYTENRRLRREIGLLFTLNFTGMAAVNNVLFVWVTAYTLAISIVAAIIILDSLSRESQR